LAIHSKEAQERAESNFRKKELQAREASKAMAEYEAGRRAEREKTARLKLLREAKEAADAAAAATAPAKTVRVEAGVDRAGAPEPAVVAAKPAAPTKKRTARTRAVARAE
jgi:hypothetical protein